MLPLFRLKVRILAAVYILLDDGICFDRRKDGSFGWVIGFGSGVSRDSFFTVVFRVFFPSLKIHPQSLQVVAFGPNPGRCLDE
jgi:hypothetical protein